MKKGEILNITITERASIEKTIGYYEDRKILLDGGLLGQEVSVLIKKIRKNRVEGKIVEVIKASKDEITSKCPSFESCGGCTFQNLAYENQLKLKEDYVKALFKKASISCGEFLSIIPSPIDFEYRNKMEFSFGDREKWGMLTLGMHEKGKHHNILSTKECILVDKDYRKILKNVEEYFIKKNITHYNKFSKSGTLRHLVVRKAYYTKEILVNLVTTSQEKIDLKEFEALILSLDLEGKVVGVLNTINDSFSDAVVPEKVLVLYGRDYIIEKCLGLDFKISAFSFFQTNTLGSEVLYKTAMGFIDDIKGKTTFDLYCGTGTIAQIIAKDAKEVYGIEIVAEAIDAAKENAKLNKIDNCHFICGDVLNEVEKINHQAEVIILDPPRAGIHPKAIDKIINFYPKTFVYVSCKATSLINDLPFFIEKGYEIKKVQLVDMFPQTPHVETVVLMSRVDK